MGVLAIVARPESPTRSLFTQVTTRSSAVCIVDYTQLDYICSSEVTSLLFCGGDQLSHGDREAAIQFERRITAHQPIRIFNSITRARDRLLQLRTLWENKINHHSASSLEHPSIQLRYPAFLRQRSAPGRRLSDIFASRHSMNQALQRLSKTGFDREDVIAVEWLNYISDDGFYRKYSAFIVGNVVIPAHLYLGLHWWLRGRNRIVTTASLLEEREYLSSNPHAGKLLCAAELCQTDFARVDYTVAQGEMRIFEFNFDPAYLTPRQQMRPMPLAPALSSAILAMASSR